MTHQRNSGKGKAGRQSPLARIGRWGRRALLLLALLLAALYLLRAPLNRLAAERLAEFIGESINGQFSYAEASLGGISTLVLREAVLKDPAGEVVLHASRVSVGVVPLTRQLRIHLAGAELNLTRFRDGKLNLSKLLRPPTERPGSKWTVVVTASELRLSYLDQAWRIKELPPLGKELPPKVRTLLGLAQPLPEPTTEPTLGLAISRGRLWLPAGGEGGGFRLNLSEPVVGRLEGKFDPGGWKLGISLRRQPADQLLGAVARFFPLAERMAGPGGEADLTLELSHRRGITTLRGLSFSLRLPRLSLGEVELGQVELAGGWVADLRGIRITRARAAYLGGSLTVKEALVRPDSLDAVLSLRLADLGKLDQSLLSHLFALPSGARPAGVVSADIRLGLKRGHPPQLELKADLDELSLFGQRGLRGRIQAHSEGELLVLERAELRGKGFTLAASGVVGKGSYQGAVVAESLPLRLLTQAGIPLPAELRGDLSGEGVVEGRLGGPPRITLTLASPEVRISDMALREASGELELAEGRLRRAAVSGHLSLSQPPLRAGFAAQLSYAPRMGWQGSVVAEGLSLPGMEIPRLGAEFYLKGGVFTSTLTGEARSGELSFPFRGKLSYLQDEGSGSLSLSSPVLAGQLSFSLPGPGRMEMKGQLRHLSPALLVAESGGNLPISFSLLWRRGERPEASLRLAGGSLILPAGGGELRLEEIRGQGKMEGGILLVEGGSFLFEGGLVEFQGVVRPDQLALTLHSPELGITPFVQLLAPGYPLVTTGELTLTVSGPLRWPTLVASYRSDLAMIGKRPLERLEFTASLTPAPPARTSPLPPVTTGKLGSLSPPGNSSSPPLPGWSLTGQTSPAVGGGFLPGRSWLPFPLQERAGEAAAPPSPTPPLGLKLHLSRLLVRDRLGELEGVLDLGFAQGVSHLGARLKLSGIDAGTLAALTGLGKLGQVSGPLFGELSGQGPVDNPDLSLVVESQALSIGQAGPGVLRLSLAKRGEVISFDELSLDSDWGTLTGQGIYHLRDPAQSLITLELPYGDLSLIGALLPGLLPPMEGRVGLRLTLTSDPEGRPVFDLDFSGTQIIISRLSLRTLQGLIHSEGGRTELRYLELSPATQGGYGGRLTASGSVPLSFLELINPSRSALAREGVSLTVATDRLTLADLAALFAPGQVELAGVAEGSLTITGSLLRPRLAGRLVAYLSHLAMRGGPGVGGIYLVSELAREPSESLNQLRIRGYKLSGAPATVAELGITPPAGAREVLSGGLSLSLYPPHLYSLDLELDLSRLGEGEISGLWRGPVDGKLALSYNDTAGRAVLGGQLEIGPGGELNLDLPTLTPASAPPLPVRIDGLLIAIRPWVRAVYRPNQLRAEISGSLLLSGTLAKPELRGSLTARDATLVAFGSRLRFTEPLEISFSPATGLTPFLRGTALMVLPGAVRGELLPTPSPLSTLGELTSLSPGDLVVYLHFNNLATEPEKIGLSSDPPLPEDQIRALLVGQYVGPVRQAIGGENIAPSLVNLGTSQIARFLEEELSLRRLELRFAPDRTIYFSVEKELGKDFVLLYRRNFHALFNETETVGMRWEFLRRYGLDAGIQLEFDRRSATEGDSRIFLFLRRRF